MYATLASALKYLHDNESETVVHKWNLRRNCIYRVIRIFKSRQKRRKGLRKVLTRPFPPPSRPLENFVPENFKHLVQYTTIYFISFSFGDDCKTQPPTLFRFGRGAPNKSHDSNIAHRRN